MGFSSRATIGAPNQSILIANQTSPGCLFIIHKHLPTPIAIGARHEPGITAGLAQVPGFPNGEPINKHGQFTNLIELLHHFSPTQMPPPDEHLGQINPLLTQDTLQLLPIRRVHRNVTLVDPNPKPLEDHPHRVAIFEGPSNTPQAGEVDHDSILGPRQSNRRVGPNRRAVGFSELGLGRGRR